MLTSSFLAIFLASLLGSLHCPGMCGGFAIYNSASSTNKWQANIFYNFGRLITYTSSGLLAGAIGSVLNNVAMFVGFTNIIAILVGLIMIFWGVKIFLTGSQLKITESKNPYWNKITSLYKSVLHNKFSLPQKTRSLLLGMITTLLPCGWLYSFLAISAASADPIKGTIIMSLFWLGTLPAMLATGIFAKFITTKLQKYIPKITAILIILAGFFSLFIHQNIDLTNLNKSQSQHQTDPINLKPSCH